MTMQTPAIPYAGRDAELAALEAMLDDQIDLADIPEVLDWSQAETGKFYRPATKLADDRRD